MIDVRLGELWRLGDGLRLLRVLRKLPRSVEVEVLRPHQDGFMHADGRRSRVRLNTLVTRYQRVELEVPRELRHISPGGRVFYFRSIDVARRTPNDRTWEISYEGERAGLLFRSDVYGYRSSGQLRWHASTRDLFWRHAADAPMGVGFDVSGHDTAEEAIGDWLRRADEIFDHEARRASVPQRLRRAGRRPPQASEAPMIATAEGGEK